MGVDVLVGVPVGVFVSVVVAEGVVVDVGVKVWVGVVVGVLVGVPVTVDVTVDVGVDVLVSVSVGVLVGVPVAVAVAVDVSVEVLVGVSVGVLVGVPVAVAVAVDVGVEVLVGVSVGVLVGVAVAVPVAIRPMVLIHVPHVAVDMFAGAAGGYSMLTPASLASRGAASTLVDNRDRSIATSVSFTMAFFLIITASLMPFTKQTLTFKTASARGSAPLKPLAQSTKPRWGWI